MKIIRKTRTAASNSAPVVHVDPIRLVVLLLMQVEPAIGIGMALCSAGAIVNGRGSDVWEVVKENFI
jgi:pyruvate dehydrogenase (quinone)